MAENAKTHSEPNRSRTSRRITGITSRPVRPEDRPFLFALYAGTRKKELDLTDWNAEQRQAFLEMQFTAQQTDYQRRFPDGDHRIVLRDGEPVGQIFVARSEEEIRLVDIILAREHQNRGIGTLLVGALVEEGKQAGSPVRHMVSKLNPDAVRFYERLGFAIRDDAGSHYLMDTGG